MKLLHHVKRENSGLLRSALELCHWEERLCHQVCVKEPNGGVLYGDDSGYDLHVIHSQIDPLKYYHDGKPKLMMMHGEPLSSVANGISMKAIVDLAPVCEAFIAMRAGELPIWNLIKKTHLVTKGVDLERFQPIPLPEGVKKLDGDPAILYCENWRGHRNPLYLVAAMRYVIEELPDAKLHLYNCNDAKMQRTFKSLSDHCKLWTFLRSLMGPAEDIVQLYNRADVVVSCLYPLYARTVVESLACGVPVVSAGYSEPGYPYTTDLSPQGFARAIVAAHRGRSSFSAREWAEKNHSAEQQAQECVAIYERYV